MMNDLYGWLLSQHHGLRTFQLFRQKLAILAADEPDQRALYTLLSLQAARYIEALDEEPVPISVADCAYETLLRLLASLDLSGSAERRLSDLNRVAAVDLLDPSADVRWDPSAPAVRSTPQGGRPNTAGVAN
ncbi:hypothetical protein [Bradyrhizobium sp. STM 3562]|uniref:hypothetical protein n=1 Tax=Bradyrhizobium sp. STM 3562 TaxID=578924 RepID=UPI00388FE872